MLSRVAERIYWSARYLERVENTARLLNVYTNLLLDLPRGVNISWYNLIVLNSTTEAFDERYKLREERNVIKFMIADDTNPNSILECIRMLRENVRTTRDTVPADTWELINELYHYAADNSALGINRGQRHEFLDYITHSCQQINGLLSGAMCRDAAWDFLSLGRNVERADMTTRILDAGISVLAQQPEDSGADLSQVVWGHVLRSLNAYLPFRRSMRLAVSGPDVVRFVIGNAQFPRTVVFCLDQMIVAVQDLPANTALVRRLKRIRRNALIDVDYEKLDSSLADYLNGLQLELADLHFRFTETWFALDKSHTP